MARNFIAASTQYLSKASATVPSMPFTMAAFARTSDATTGQTIMAFGSSSDTAPYWVLQFRGDVASDPIRAAQRDNASVEGISVGANYSINTWYHCGVVFNSSSSRTCYVNGIAGTPDTTVLGATTVNQFAIGSYWRATPVALLNGDVAEAAIWTVALTAGEIGLLAKGTPPLYIRPASLLYYWKILGDASPEPDNWGLWPLTVNNSPLKIDHYSIFGGTLPIAEQRRDPKLRARPFAPGLAR